MDPNMLNWRLGDRVKFGSIVLRMQNLNAFELPFSLSLNDAAIK